MSAYQSGWASQNVAKFMPTLPQEMKRSIVEDELMALSDKAWWKSAHAYCWSISRLDLQSQACLWASYVEHIQAVLQPGEFVKLRTI